MKTEIESTIVVLNDATTYSSIHDTFVAVVSEDGLVSLENDDMEECLRHHTKEVISIAALLEFYRTHNKTP